MSGERGHPLVFLFRAGTEGLWVMALAGFLMHVTVGRAFPFALGAASLLSAAGVGRALAGRAWRRAGVLGLHLAGVLAILTWGLWEALPGGEMSPAGGDWRNWAWILQIAFWTGLLWVKGAALLRNPGTHERLCSQFDKGIAAFGCVLLTSLFLEAKWGIPAAWDAVLPCFVGFFVLSIAAMGMMPLDGEGGPETGAARATGTAFAFAVGVAGIGGGAVLLLMPLLMEGAQLGLEALKTSSSPLGPHLVRILRFLFSRQRTVAEKDLPEGPDAATAPTGTGRAETTVLEEVFGWGLTGFLGAVLAATAGIVLFHVAKALLGRTADRRGVFGGAGPFLDRLRHWLDRVRGLSMRRMLGALADPGPVRLFIRLSVWGRRSGLPRRPAETPLEYGRRLCSRFEGLSEDILLLVDLLNRQVYGDIPPGPAQRKSGLRAWRRLRSPRHWGVRLHGLLGFSPRPGESIPEKGPSPFDRQGALSA